MLIQGIERGTSGLTVTAAERRVLITCPRPYGAARTVPRSTRPGRSACLPACIEESFLRRGEALRPGPAGC